MCEDQRTYVNLVERIADTFSEIDSDIVTDLYHTNTEYAKLRVEADSLQKKHPIIESMLEGKGEISLSEEEHDALVRYLSLKMQIEEAERQQIYFRGHTDSFVYLKKIGAI